MSQRGSRRWVFVLAGVLIALGALAVLLPLTVQRLNYAAANREAQALEDTLAIPGEDAYQPVDYAAMPQGNTPVYNATEMQQAGDAPNVLDSLIPASLLPTALAEEGDETRLLEGMTLREAMESAGMLLDECPGSDALADTLKRARKRVEQGFFILTGVQPAQDTETLPRLEAQKAVDDTTRRDKAVTAARGLVYDTLTDFEGLLYQLETRLTGGEPEAVLMDEARTLGSYFTLFALHLPGDDFASLTAHTPAKQAAAVLPGNVIGKGAENPNAEIDPIDQESEVKRGYLLEIPGIGVKVTCYRSGTFNRMYENMKKGVAFFPRAPEPNTVGNICISGHRTGTRDYFRKLDKLSAGDTVYLHTTHLGSFKYEVLSVYIIERDDWNPTRATDYPALTLISCEASQGVSNGKRIVVRAKLVATAPNAE